jgi:hypothetical protein
MTSRVFVALRVPADPMRAFEVFTREIGEWWQASGLFGITAQCDGSLAFEPGTGGRLFTTLDNGEEFEIGRISVWELVFSWRQASFASNQATEVEVRFQAVGSETRVSVEHRGWETIPEDHAARHRIPEPVFLQRAADWWRNSLDCCRQRMR